MNPFLITSSITGVVLIALVLLQVRDGGISLALTGTSNQAPLERRGSAKTLHVITVILAIVFVGSCLASFLFS
jgi:protein translocase SecG subunit